MIALQCHLPDNSQRNFEIFTSFAELNQFHIVRASVRVFAELPGRYLFDCRTACALVGAAGTAGCVVTQQQVQDMAVPWSIVFRVDPGLRGPVLAEVLDAGMSFYRAGFQMGALVAAAGFDAVVERSRAAERRARRARAEDVLRQVRADLGVLHHSTDSEDSSSSSEPVREEPSEEVAGPEEIGVVDLNALLTFGGVSPRMCDAALFLVALRGFLLNPKNLRLLCSRSVLAGVARAMDRFSRVPLIQRCALDFLTELLATGPGLEAAVRGCPAIFGRVRRAGDLLGAPAVASIMDVLRGVSESLDGTLRLEVPAGVL